MAEERSRSGCGSTRIVSGFQCLRVLVRQASDQFVINSEEGDLDACAEAMSCKLGVSEPPGPARHLTISVDSSSSRQGS